VHSFERARISHAAPVQLAVAPRAVPAARAAVEPVTIGALATLPEIKLDHLRAMTDSCGMLQHASFTIPRYEEGYCLDDNARALLLVTQLGAVDETMRRHVRAEATRYLAFVRYAFNASTGRFRNFMSFGREWLEAQGSEDSHGRAVWSLAAVSNIGGDAGRVRLATELFHAALPATLTFTSPRAWAFTLLGIDSYWGAHPVDGDVERWRDQLSDRLYQLYLDTSRDAWPWFEEEVTYCNARLPQALLVSGARRNHTGMIDAGLRALQWLSDVQTGPVGYFAPIGSAGFFASNGNKAEFDQQPVEAGGMVSACLAAARITGDAMWQMQAQRAMYWFLGENQTLTPLYDSTTGGCRDGLHAERPNENQGAEATLSFLLALHEFTHANSNGGAL
jgi:hypothetical protein